MKVKVTNINGGIISFEGGYTLESHHDSECCETHYLSLDDLTMEDFEGLEFDLSSDAFFKRIDNYGIELVPLHGHSVKIPGYGHNNGYYSDRLDLVLSQNNIQVAEFNITECQVITD